MEKKNISKNLREVKAKVVDEGKVTRRLVFERGKTPETLKFYFFEKSTLGDMIAFLPVLKKMKEAKDKIYRVYFKGDTSFIRGLGFDDIIITDQQARECEAFKDGTFNAPGVFPDMGFNRAHVIDYLSLNTINEILDDSEKTYIKYPIEEDVSSFGDLSKSIVIGVSYTTKVKRISAEAINKIIDYVISRGYRPILTGIEREYIPRRQGPSFIDKGIDKSRTLNLIGSLSLRQLPAVISKSALYVGMDGGTVHLAAMTDTPIVAGYTFNDPKYWLPYRNGKLGHGVTVVTPPSSLGCRFCKHDIWDWYRSVGLFCPYDDYKCLISGDQFVEGIRGALDINEAMAELKDNLSSALKEVLR